MDTTPYPVTHFHAYVISDPVLTEHQVLEFTVCNEEGIAFDVFFSDFDPQYEGPEQGTEIRLTCIVRPGRMKLYVKYYSVL